MFRQLDVVEEREFRQWARDNFDPSTDTVNSVWHPAVRDECMEMIDELADNLADTDSYILRNS